MSRILQLFALCIAALLVTQAAVPSSALAKRKARKASVDYSAAKHWDGTSKKRQLAAIKGLVDSQNPAGVDRLLNELAKGVHPKVAVRALGALASLISARTDRRPQDKKAFATFVAYLGHRSAAVRQAALAAMVSTQPRRAKKHILSSLGDADAKVRSMAMKAAADGSIRAAIAPMIKLLQRGEEAAAYGVARMADANTARKVAELVGAAPDRLIALCLGEILAQESFGPDSVRVDLVQAIAALKVDEAVIALSTYIATAPENAESRRVAEKLVQQKLEGEE